MNSSRDVTPRESDVDFASETEAADFSPEELIWGVAWLCEWDWLAELEVDRLVEREVDSEESWLALDETSVLAGSWRLAEADPYTTVDSFTAFEAKAEADDQFDACDIEWLDEVDLSVEVEDWLEALVWCDAEVKIEMDSDTESDSDSLLEIDAEFNTDSDLLTDTDSLVNTESDVDVDSNSEACLRAADSDALSETDAEFKTHSDTLADALVDVET